MGSDGAQVARFLKEWRDKKRFLLLGESGHRELEGENEYFFFFWGFLL